MKGDRVVVGTGYVWQETKDENGKFEMVMTYGPTLMEDGSQQVTPDGGVVVTRLGGVVAGSTGTIQGAAINVHRSYLHNAADYGSAAYGGKDFVQMVPVFLDKYQKLGWFPVDNIRIFGGSPS